MAARIDMLSVQLTDVVNQQVGGEALLQRITDFRRAQNELEDSFKTRIITTIQNQIERIAQLVAENKRLRPPAGGANQNGAPPVNVNQELSWWQRVANWARDFFLGQMESKELHHIPPQRDGGLFDFIEVWPSEHAELDKLRRLRK